jgi:hypothetical protein
MCMGLVLVALAGCGGSGGGTAGGGVLPGGVVARVGGYTVTQAFLDEWMNEQAGEDFFLEIRKRAPSGLVSEPANLPSCVAAAKRALASAGAKAGSTAQLMRKCRELYEAIKAQALGYVLSSYWSLNFDAKYGLHVSEAEVRHAFAAMKAEQYPEPGSLQKVIYERTRTIGQELFIIRNDILQAKLRRLFKEGTNVTDAFIKSAKRVSDSAVCSPGYIVEHCKGYEPPKERFARTIAGSPAELLAELTR